MVRFYSNEDVAALLDMETCIDRLEVAYRALHEGRAASTPRTDLYMEPEGPADWYRFKTMGGAIEDLDVCALRIDSDLMRFPTVDGTIRREKVTKHGYEGYRVGNENGLVFVYDPRTAEPLAIMPDGEIQRHRVGATSGIAAKYLAPADASEVGLIGSGFQAVTQLRALDALFDLAAVDVYSQTRSNREAFADRFDGELAADVAAAPSAAAAVEGKDIVVTATSAMEPIVDPDWLAPGVHVSTVKKEEIAAAGIERADLAVVHSRAHIKKQDVYAGEERENPETRDGWWTDRSLPLWEELRSLEAVVGEEMTRRSSSESTLFVNNLGLGVQFAACGDALVNAEGRDEYGHELPTEWFLQDFGG